MFAHSHAECGQKEGLRKTPKVLGLSSWRDGVPFIAVGKSEGGTELGRYR